MRVLVTGGAGFIGSHLTDAFLRQGDEVTVVDDLSAGSASRLDERAVLHKQSIIHAEPFARLAAEIRPELICHLAAKIDVRASVAFPADDARVNVVGTINVLEAARRADARMLFCSTGGALYGTGAPIPSPESVLPLPESPYGVAKNCAEQYVGLYNRLHRTRHAVLRLANVYGPRQDPAWRGPRGRDFLLPDARGEAADHLWRWQTDPRLRLCRRRCHRLPGRGGHGQARHLEHRDRDRDQRPRPGHDHRPGRGTRCRAGIRLPAARRIASQRAGGGCGQARSGLEP